MQEGIVRTGNLWMSSGEAGATVRQFAGAVQPVTPPRLQRAVHLVHDLPCACVKGPLELAARVPTRTIVHLTSRVAYQVLATEAANLN